MSKRADGRQGQQTRRRASSARAESRELPKVPSLTAAVFDTARQAEPEGRRHEGDTQTAGPFATVWANVDDRREVLLAVALHDQPAVVLLLEPVVRQSVSFAGRIVRPRTPRTDIQESSIAILDRYDITEFARLIDVDASAVLSPPHGVV